MIYRFADCMLDIQTHALTRGGEPVSVEPQVFDLLHLMVRHPGELLTKERLVDEIWGGRIISESAMSARIAAARKAVGDDGKRQAVIRTVARRGVRFVAELQDAPAPVAAAPATPTGPAPIRYASAPDGARIAWTVNGSGPPAFRIGFFPGHLVKELSYEYDAAYIERLTQEFSLYRFDARGSGLSDLSRFEMTVETKASDAAAVAKAAGLGCVPTFAKSGACLEAVAYAALYPERVSRLVLLGGYVQGRAVRDGSDPDSDALLALLKTSWGQSQSAFLQAFGAAYLPSATRAQQIELGRWFFDTTTKENMIDKRRFIDTVDISHYLPQVRCPTLVIHAAGDAVHPLDQGQRLAAGIPNAEMMVLDTDNHIPTPGDPAFDAYLDAMADFMRRDGG